MCHKTFIIRPSGCSMGVPSFRKHARSALNTPQLSYSGCCAPGRHVLATPTAFTPSPCVSDDIPKRIDYKHVLVSYAVH